MSVLADALVLLGACILGASLVPVRRIVAVVPPGGLRRSWYVLGALVLLLATQEGSGEDVRATVSIGIASLAPGMRAAQELLSEAGAALYRAKNAGRNRAVAGGTI